jgi:AcrR family transcriptional regulator
VTTHLRADAQRNLERVLEAAVDAFAEEGADVSVDEIARRAGVGHATVFRRFPTKESLIAAVVSRRVEGLVESATGALERPDAGEAFREFVWHAGETFAADRALFDGLGRCVEVPEVAEAKAELHAAVQQLIARAQANGALRPDVDAEDISLLVGSAIQATRQSGDPEAWRRYLAVVLDGLRPPAGVQ